MMAVTVATFIASIVIIILMYLWFGKGDGCDLQNTSVSITLLMSIVFSFLSIARGIVGDRGSLLVSAVLTFYCCWMNFAALSSDPSACNTVADRDSLFWLIVGLVWSGISVTYSGWNASSRASTFVESSDKESYDNMREEKSIDVVDQEEEEAAAMDVSTLRSFFLVMGACAMYMAMLLTSWASAENLNNTTNLSVQSMWVQLISEWAVIALYFWVLLAPALFPDRDFS
jgi:hypothetical protein